MAKFWFAKQHKLETFDHDIKVVLGVYCLLSRHAYENMFNLKPVVCLVTEPPGVSCVSAGDRELSPSAARQCAAVSSVLWQRTSFYPPEPHTVSCAATLAPCRPAHCDQHDDTP